MIEIPPLTSIPEYAEAEARLADVAAKRRSSESRLNDLCRQRDKGNDTASNVAFILAGDDHLVPEDIETQIRREQTKLAALAEAERVLDLELAKARTDAARKVNDAVKPAHDRAMRRLCESLVAAREAHAELFAFERRLIGDGIGLHQGVCANMATEFLGIPSDKASELSEFLRQAQRNGHLKSLPRDLR